MNGETMTKEDAALFAEVLSEIRQYHALYKQLNGKLVRILELVRDTGDAHLLEHVAEIVSEHSVH